MDLNSPELKPFVFLVGFLLLSNIGVVLKFVLDMFRDRDKDLKTEIKGLTDSINKSNLSITRLDVQMEHLNKFLRKIETLEDDLDALHDKVRSLANGAGSSNTN